MTPPSKPAPNGTADVAITLDDRDSRTYHVFVAVVREPFDGATATDADGSTASFPEAETVRQFRRANNDSRVTDATFIYFLYTEPFDPTRSTTDVIVCNGGTLGPVRFTVESGSQRFEPGCFQGTPGE